MIGKRHAFRIAEIADGLRLRLPSRNVSSRRTSPAGNDNGRPHDLPPKMKGKHHRHPIPEVRVLLDTRDIIVDRSGAGFVQRLVFVAPAFQFAEQALSKYRSDADNDFSRHSARPSAHAASSPISLVSRFES